jgi:hypothetical protein
MVSIAMVFLYAFLPASLGASCLERSVEEYYRDAAMVFLGTVVDIDASGVEFEIERSWKIHPDTGWIRIPLHANPRDVQFVPGSEYLVYVTRDSYGARTSYCNGTKERARSEADLLFLMAIDDRPSAPD